MALIRKMLAEIRFPDKVMLPLGPQVGDVIMRFDYNTLTSELHIKHKRKEGENERMALIRKMLADIRFPDKVMLPLDPR